MRSFRQLTRVRAAALHLAISAVIAALAVTVMLALWYPPPLFGAMGGRLLLALIVGVDVAIGPLITLIIFDPRKKELAFDLATIAVLQLCALAYGIHAMHAGRPVFMAFVEDRFAVVSAASIEDEALEKAPPRFRSLSWSGPVMVVVDMPTDIAERNNIVFAGLGGIGAQHLPQYYAPYADRIPQVLAAARPLDRLSIVRDDERAELEKVVAHLGRPIGDMRFLPVETDYAALTALIDANSGALLATVAARPRPGIDAPPMRH